jgi:hypothetical protein
MEHLPCSIVVKPGFAWFEACRDRVARCLEMLRCMLTWRVVAATDMNALCAAPQVQPPSVCSKTFDASGAAWWYCRIDTGFIRTHLSYPPGAGGPLHTNTRTTPQDQLDSQEQSQRTITTREMSPTPCRPRAETLLLASSDQCSTFAPGISKCHLAAEIGPCTCRSKVCRHDLPANSQSSAI